MFDAITEKPRPRRWQTAVIIGSAAAHAAALAMVVVGAMWHVEKLDLHNPADITFRVPPPPGESAPPPAAEKLAVKTATPKVVKVKPDVIVQPLIVADPDPVPTGGGGGDQTGGGGGGSGTDPEAKGTCLVEPCIDGSDGDPPKRDPVVVVEKKPPVVPPHVAKGLRVSGNDQIYPPELVRVEMLHQGKDMVQATVQLCVSAQGQVDSLRFLKRTGFKGYDDTLAREMREWQYKPYRVDGVPSPMCTVAVVIYRMRK